MASHIFLLLSWTILWYMYCLEIFVGLGMLTYSAFMEKKQEHEFNSIQ